MSPSIDGFANLASLCCRPIIDGFAMGFIASRFVWLTAEVLLRTWIYF